MILWVIQHGCADTKSAVLFHQDVMIDTTFATFPESVIIGKLGKGYWYIFITAAPLVRLNILAHGQRRRANLKVASLMRFAMPRPW